ncbi:MAG: hypothetical protein C0614_03660 [Desulfuromonas sp.]|nr:MAG: hypothetical protein C0614_03660 [Desulfuromonas sp.]
MANHRKSSPSRQHETILRVLCVVLSLLSSFALVFYGISLIGRATPGLHLSVFAYVTIAYGLGNIAILSLAWTSRVAGASMAYQLLALCYFGIFVVDTLKGGIGASNEVIGLLLLAAILYSNGLAIRKVVERPVRPE